MLPVKREKWFGGMFHRRASKYFRAVCPDSLYCYKQYRHVETTLRGCNFFPVFVFFSLFFFLLHDGKTSGEQHARRSVYACARELGWKMCGVARRKTRGMKLLFHLISGGTAILIAPVVAPERIEKFCFENPLPGRQVGRTNERTNEKQERKKKKNGTEPRETAES